MGFRINYEVKGHMAFLSHLEMMRMWQRALLRSKLPIAWSQGFNPRPKLSLGPAKGVGIEGFGEYLDMEFTTALDGDELMKTLNGVLPLEVRVLNLRELPRGAKLLEAIINEAVYKINFQQGLPLDIQEKITEFLAQETVPYLRHSPKKDKELDLRSFVYDLEIKDKALLISVKTGPKGSMRPEELLTVLGYWDIISDIKIQRLGLYIREANRHSNP
ncbi:MAG: TIGR03936 family radical SAM-associated protein [Clostridiales bacterium]